MGSPLCFAAKMLPRATFESERSTTIGARPGSGQAKAIGLVPKTPTEPPCGAIADGRVREEHRDESALGEPLGRMAGRAGVMRAPDRRRRDALLAGDGGQFAHREIERRKGEAVRGVDGDDAGPPAPARRPRETVDLADLRLCRVGRHP